MLDRAVVTPALENYLEAIYILAKVKKPVKIIDISRYLGVKMPSVTYNMKKLADRGLVHYNKRLNVELTEEGEKIGRGVHRTHEELFRFFHDILGVGREAAEQDACRAEHTLGRETVDRLAAFSRWAAALPEEHAYVPHNPNFGDGGNANGAETVSLSAVSPGRRVRIVRVKASGEIRKRIVEMGLNRGAEAEVIRVAPLGDPVELKVRGSYLSLRLSEAADIEVETIE